MTCWPGISMHRSQSQRLCPFLGVSAALLLSACGKSPAPASAPQPVSVTRVQQRAVPFKLVATGQVEPMQTVVVTAQVGGPLLHVRFREGDDVRQGQTLF